MDSAERAERTPSEVSTDDFGTPLTFSNVNRGLGWYLAVEQGRPRYGEGPMPTYDDESDSDEFGSADSPKSGYLGADSVAPERA